MTKFPNTLGPASFPSSRTTRISWPTRGLPADPGLVAGRCPGRPWQMPVIGDPTAHQIQIRIEFVSKERWERWKKPTLSRPVVIDDTDILSKDILTPLQSAWISPFSSEEKTSKVLLETYLFKKLPSGIFPTYSPHSRGGREHDISVIVLEDTPESSCIRGSHRLSLIENGGHPIEKRAIDDIAMSYDPSNIAGTEDDVTLATSIKVLHGPPERDGVSSRLTYYTLLCTRYLINKRV